MSEEQILDSELENNILDDEVVTGGSDEVITDEPTTDTEPTTPTTPTAPTYSYDPSQIYDNGLNQMRFELQDNIIEGEGVTCALCDEEYKAIIENEKLWKRAKLKCLKAIIMKFAYEVNTSTDGLSYSLNERYPRWKAMYDDLKKTTTLAVPVCDPSALGNPPGRPPYFYENMHTNIRKL